LFCRTEVPGWGGAFNSEQLRLRLLSQTPVVIGRRRVVAGLRARGDLVHSLARVPELVSCV
jgi:hypothetical protein